MFNIKLVYLLPITVFLSLASLVGCGYSMTSMDALGQATYGSISLSYAFFVYKWYKSVFCKTDSDLFYFHQLKVQTSLLLKLSFFYALTTSGLLYHNKVSLYFSAVPPTILLTGVLHLYYKKAADAYLRFRINKQISFFQ